MGYGRALLQKDVRSEEASLRKKSKKKGLWGSIGRTLGGLAATAFTGGAAAPWAMGLAAGGGTLLGGAIGSTAGGKLTGGKFFQEDRKSLQRELGAFGSRNLTESLKGAVTAGIGQKLKLASAGRAAKAGGATAEEAAKIAKGAKGFDFAESTVGRGLQKAKLAAGPTVERATLSPIAQKMASDPMGTMKGIEVTTAGKEAKLSEFLGQQGEFATEFGEDVRFIGSEGRVRGKDPFLKGAMRRQELGESAMDWNKPESFSTQMPSVPEEHTGGVDPRGLQRMRVAEDVSEFTTQTPVDISSEFGEDARSSISTWGVGTKPTFTPWQLPKYKGSSTEQLQQSLGMIEKLGLSGSSGYDRSGLRSSIRRY